MKYQIKPLGTLWRIDDLKATLEPYPDITICDEVDDKYPFLYLYYGYTLDDSNFGDYQFLKKLISKRDILPIAHTHDDFKTNFPDGLSDLNGFFLDDTTLSLSALHNYIFSYFGIISGNRKVFISYRRSETEVLAQTLYDKLIKLKYHPFLDSYSIESGVDFQERLRHELVDSDIVVLLDTPDFNNSDYCMEEFNIANSEQIPVIDIRINVNPKENTHRFCDYIEVDGDMQTITGDSAFADRIIDLMERSRAKAYCIKRKFVIAEFEKRCKEFNLDIVEQGGFMRCDTTKECFFPFTNIPNASDLYELTVKMSKIPIFTTYAKHVLYNGNYCTPDYQKQLDWYNDNLPVKTFNINK